MIPDSIPKASDKSEATTSITPIFNISFIWPAYIPLSIKLAIRSGITTSIITSSVTRSGVNKAGFLYSLTDFPNVLSISLILYLSFHNIFAYNILRVFY